MMGGSKHEIGARLADLSAVLKQPLVFRLGMLSAHLKTMSCRFQTQRMTLEAVGDALPHFRGKFMFVHGRFLFVSVSVWPGVPFKVNRASGYMRSGSPKNGPVRIVTGKAAIRKMLDDKHQQ